MIRTALDKDIAGLAYTNLAAIHLALDGAMDDDAVVNAVRTM